MLMKLPSVLHHNFCFGENLRRHPPTLYFACARRRFVINCERTASQHFSMGSTHKVCTSILLQYIPRYAEPHAGMRTLHEGKKPFWFSTLRKPLCSRTTESYAEQRCADRHRHCTDERFDTGGAVRWSDCASIQRPPGPYCGVQKCTKFPVLRSAIKKAQYLKSPMSIHPNFILRTDTNHKPAPRG